MEHHDHALYSDTQTAENWLACHECGAAVDPNERECVACGYAVPDEPTLAELLEHGCGLEGQ